jgi:hypothetical protein
VSVSVRAARLHYVHLIAVVVVPAVVVPRVGVAAVAAAEGLVQVLVPAALVRQVSGQVRHVAQGMRAPLAHGLVQYGQDRRAMASNLFDTKDENEASLSASFHNGPMCTALTKQWSGLITIPPSVPMCVERCPYSCWFASNC